MLKLSPLPAIGEKDNDPSGLNGKWQQEVFLNMKHFMAFRVSRYLSFKSCLCISEDPKYVNIKNQKIYDLFSMNVQCIFLKHAHQDF